MQHRAVTVRRTTHLAVPVGTSDSQGKNRVFSAPYKRLPRGVNSHNRHSSLRHTETAPRCDPLPVWRHENGLFQVHNAHLLLHTSAFDKLTRNFRVLPKRSAMQPGQTRCEMTTFSILYYTPTLSLERPYPDHHSILHEARFSNGPASRRQRPPHLTHLCLGCSAAVKPKGVVFQGELRLQKGMMQITNPLVDT